MEPIIEDVGVEEEHGRGHNASEKVVYPHPLGLCRRADAISQGNTAVPENLRLHRNSNHALQKFGKVEPCLRHSFLKLKFAHKE